MFFTKKSVKIGMAMAILFAFVSTSFKSETGKYFEIAKNIEIFANLYKEVNTYYVDDLEPSKLMRTGLDAMLHSLDPYTNYISESEMEGFKYMAEGRYNGIGAQIEVIDDYITIAGLYKDSPAMKANLKVGDMIVAVDGKSAKGKSHDEVDAILKGYPGTDVELTIRRPGEKKEFTTTLTRGEVKVPNVPYSGMLSNDIGYIVLTTFTRQAGNNVKKALKKLKKDHPDMKGVILDLRNNGGGLLTEAVNVANVFIDKDELVVKTRGKIKEWDRTFKTLNAPVDLDIPLAVMINKNAASASEIVSGVMQDLDRGILVGQRSYGKGLVQNTRDVGYHSKVKMTIAKYYIPSNRCIQAVSYKDGEPVDVPDEKRSEFKTRNGRIVRDGGGLKPDLYLPKEETPVVIEELKKQHIIFKYANVFCYGLDSIDAPDKFHFDKWDDFQNFLTENHFQYETKSEKLLDELLDSSGKEKLSVLGEINHLKQKIAGEKNNAIEQYKDEIVKLIEKEIVGRYYFKRGEVQINLRNDAELDAAVEALSDVQKYKATLNL